MTDNAAPHPLHSLFWPRSVAVIGASPDLGRIRGRLLAFLVNNGYAGDILPINPSHREILGRTCYPSIEAVGRPVDVALIAIPADRVLIEIERCAAAGVKHAVIVASGFAEEGGASAAIQERMVGLARRSGMRISGPNAEGFYNAPLNLAATFSPTLQQRPELTPRISASKVGVVAQSGGVGFALFQQGLRVGLDFSYVMTSGNEADLTMADYLDYMVADAQTQVILLYCETIRDGARFEQAALRALAVGKRIVVVKVGQSESGHRAAASHTASMAGWQAAYGALFQRCGLFQANDMDEALALCALLVTGPLALGKRVGVVTASGGAGAWAGDTVERSGGTVPALSAALQARIRELIPSYGGTTNPIDVTAQGARSGAMLQVVDLLANSNEVDAILLVHSLTIQHFVLDRAELARIAAAQKKPLIFYSFSIPTPLALTELARAGIGVTTNLPGTCSALIKLAQPQPTGYAPRVAHAADITVATLPGTEPLLCEYEAKEFLRRHGIDASSEGLAATVDDAIAIANRIGYPVALKVQSPLLPHKTDVGGVQLGLGCDAEVRKAFVLLRERALRHISTAQLQGLLVQRMAPRGLELIVGTIRDEMAGPLVQVGFGGVAVELYRDVVYRLAPVTLDGAGDMLGSLRGARLLAGFRGRAALDIEPVAQLVVRISQLAWDYRDHIDELELNPVIVHDDGSGFSIVDALLRRRSPAAASSRTGAHTEAIRSEAMS